jgi:CheY-like chemotaxis protein
MNEGTGLGLFVVQNIIDKYEGAITVESKKGIGSTFKVYLPLLENKEFIDKNKNTENISLTSKKRILVVDDNKDILKVLKKGLKHAGYEVEIETDSLKALETFTDHPESYDLVLTDFMMLNLKGNELAAAIKSVRGDMKIILMTGYMDESIESMESNKLIEGYILKPIELNELYKIIANIIDK